MLTVVLPLTALILYLLRSGRWRQLRVFLAPVSVLLGSAALNFALVACARWVAMNDFSPRYFVPGYLMLASIGGISLWTITMISVRGYATRAAVFSGLATVLLSIGYQHLREQGDQVQDIVGNGRSGIATEVAARYVALSMDGIVGDFHSY